MGNLSSLASGSGHAAWIWRNGELTPWESAQAHVTAVGHSSAVAVFEGIKAYLSPDGSRRVRDTFVGAEDHLG